MNPQFTKIIHDFVRNMTTAVANASLYSLDHPQVTRLCSHSLSELESIFTESEEISLLLIDSELVSEGIPLGSGLYISRFIQLLKNKGIGHIKLTAGITVDELRHLVDSLRKGSMNAETSSTEHLRFGKVAVRYALNDHEDSGTAELRKLAVFAEMPDAELHRLMEIYDGVQRHRKLRVNGVDEIVSSFIQTFKAHIDPILAISPLKALDEYTFTHSTNVCILNLAQAMALGIDGQLLHEIGLAAMLHDMGKLFIPEDVLTKTGKLDEKEWELMKLHPVRGAQYLLSTPGVPQLAVITAFEHHMNYDLSGYPQVPTGWRQHLCSQMTTISDFFDAMRTTRSYRASVGYDEVSAMMLEMSGTQMNPLLVTNFLGLLNKATRI
jgi:HD-GYP domain-containing protein (c-di-GMP phosphodiesterase class II)